VKTAGVAPEMHPRRCIEVHFKMKKLLIFALVAAVPAAAQWRRFGQEEVRPTGWFGVGAATPINPLATRLDTGWSISGGAGITSKYVGIMLDANYTDFGINREELRRIGAPRGFQKYWSVTVDPVFHVNQRGPVDFYVTGGAGLYSQVTQYRLRGGGGFDRDDLLYSNAVYKPGVNGGAGFAFNIGGRRNRVKIFTEARFHHMFIGQSGANYIPVTVGVRF
jgi:hypothetical protein